MVLHTKSSKYHCQLRFCHFYRSLCETKCVTGNVVFNWMLYFYELVAFFHIYVVSFEMI